MVCLRANAIHWQSQLVPLDISPHHLHFDAQFLPKLCDTLLYLGHGGRAICLWVALAEQIAAELWCQLLNAFPS